MRNCPLTLSTILKNINDKKGPILQFFYITVVMVNKGDYMYALETRYFGKLQLTENIDEINHRILINEDNFVDVYFKNCIETITMDNINQIKYIIDSYYAMKDKSEKYIVENYLENNEINYYFEDLFADYYGGALFVYFKLNNNNNKDLDELMELPIKEKIKLMPLPDLKIYYNIEHKYDIRMVFNSVKNEYRTSLWFHYNIELELKEFWVDEIDPWK